jgi:deazaflavin-dependent oxidoreductase (nitroreductase family)
MAIAAVLPGLRPTPNRFQRWIQRLARIAWVTRVLAPIVQAVDRIGLAWSGDRWCLTSSLTGLPVVRITTIGARSGRPRTHPLTALPEGDRFALIGSNFGRRRSPAWVYNLRAHPLAIVRQARRAAPYEVCPATPEEYDRLWSRAVSLYPGYATYAARAAPRLVPIFVLTPVGDG